jgi:hypothetical protein
MLTGDLLFTQIGSSDNAIFAVSEGYKGARVNHVGTVVNNQFGRFVLEAFPPEVRLTNIKVYINRSKDENGNPRYMAGRLKKEYSHLIPDAISYGLRQRDIPYNKLYLAGEPALYCSQLVVDMFKHANKGVPFFKESPMSFSDMRTGEIHKYWVRYYSYFGMPVPEGEPGSNPGDISRDNKLEIYRVEGDITGYKP